MNRRLHAKFDYEGWANKRNEHASGQPRFACFRQLYGNSGMACLLQKHKKTKKLEINLNAWLGRCLVVKQPYIRTLSGSEQCTTTTN